MKITSREILATKNKKYVNLDQETLEELMYRPSRVYASIFKKEGDKDLELEFRLERKGYPREFSAKIAMKAI